MILITSVKMGKGQGRTGRKTSRPGYKKRCWCGKRAKFFDDRDQKYYCSKHWRELSG